MEKKIILKNLSLIYQIKNIRNISLKKYIVKTFIDKNFFEKEIHALENINLEISEGSKIGISGPNGSGKSSLLKIIAQIISPTSGIVDMPYTSSFLGSSNFSFIPLATGEENALLYLNLKKIDKKLENDFLDKIHTISKLGKFFYQPVRIYSSGMLLRLAFACTEVISSDVLILDEWISTADQEMKEYISNTINDKIKNSLITIIASHDLELLKKNSNLIIYLNNGKIEKTEKITI